MHTRLSGVADHLAQDDAHALELVRVIVATLPAPAPPPWASAPSEPPAVDPARALRRRPARRALDLRRPRGDRADRRREPLPRVQGALRADARLRLRAHPRPPGRHPRQQRRALLAERAQGRALHRAVRPPRRAAAVPAEHQRLHGRARLRARRHRQGRREAGHRRQLRARAEADRDHRRLLRRRQLRDVRPRVRPALPVDVAERADQRDGRRAGGDRALDDPLGPARGPRRGVAGGGARGVRGRACASSTSARVTRTTRPRGCGTTASSTRCRRATCSASALAACANAPLGEVGYGVFRM